MTKLDFPDTPTTGQQFGSSGTVWRWDGTRWGSTAGAAGARGTVAYQQLTSNIPGFNATSQDIGLSATFTAVAGRRYKITGTAMVNASVVPNQAQLYIRDGAGFNIMQGGSVIQYLNTTVKLLVEAVVSPPAGPITYKLWLGRTGATSGDINLYADPTYPTFILVEDITYEAGTGGPTSDAFIVRTGDTMSGQLNGITPVAAANLTRKDYVDKNYWNSAWGSYGRTQVNVDQPIYGAETPLHGGASNFPFTPVAGRLYRFCLAFETFGSCATFFRAYFANVQYYVWALNTPAGEQTHELFSPPFALPAGGGTVGYTHIWRAGSGCTIQAAGFQGTFTWIEDIGPVTRQ